MNEREPRLAKGLRKNIREELANARYAGDDHRERDILARRKKLLDEAVKKAIESREREEKKKPLKLNPLTEAEKKERRKLQYFAAGKPFNESDPPPTPQEIVRANLLLPYYSLRENRFNRPLDTVADWQDRYKSMSEKYPEELRIFMNTIDPKSGDSLYERERDKIIPRRTFEALVAQLPSHRSGSKI